MFSYNCYFLTCIQISQVAGRVVWYSHLFQNFPQFVVVHTIKGFVIVNKAEVDIFLKLSCFSMIKQMLTIWSLVPLPFSKTSLNIWKFMVNELLKPGLENFEHYSLISLRQASCCVVRTLKQPYGERSTRQEIEASCQQLGPTCQEFSSPTRETPIEPGRTFKAASSPDPLTWLKMITCWLTFVSYELMHSGQN